MGHVHNLWSLLYSTIALYDDDTSNKFCIPYAKFLLWMLFSIRVRYFSTSTPLYIGDIVCRGMQNYSYIYGGANLISVI